MPAAHPGVWMGLGLRQVPGRAAYTTWAPYPFLPSCGIHRACNRSSRPSERFAPESTACIRIAPRCRKTGTACSNAIRNCTSGIFLVGQNPPQAPRRSSNSVPASPCRPSAASAAPGDRSPPGVLPVGASAPCLSFRAVPASPRLDTRGAHTYDPQTPPSVSRTRTVTAISTRLN